MRKYCLTLKERPDKESYVRSEFERVGIKNVEFVYGVKTPNGRDGCRMGHLSIMNRASKESMFAVFEDDAKFLYPISDIRKAMLELPDDWDGLWLGSTLTQDLDRYSEHLYRLKKGWCTHAMIFNNQHGIADYILNHADKAFKIDVFYADVIQEEFNCYITYPMMVTQQEGYSDIIRKHQTYQVITDWYNKHTTL